MGFLRLPTGPAFDSTLFDRLLDQESADRRALLKGGAGLGLAAAALIGAGGRAFAQDQPTPPGEDVGSDPHSMGTGHSSPVPQGQPVWSVYDPFVKPVEPGDKDITLVAKDVTTLISKDVAYAAWTFNGTVPGPTLRARQGDTIDFTFQVDPTASTAHSVDFHSSKAAPNEKFKTIMPGEEFKWSYKATTPGCFMYHCGTPPVLMHIGTGMYGTMIVDPEEGWEPAQELIFVQSDFYLKEGENGVMVPDYTKMLGNGNMDFVVFNGYANQYVENPINVKVGEPIRIFVLNAGPNVWATFHVVGAIFDKAYFNANPKNVLHGMQSMPVGPGDGIAVEFTLEEPGEYVAVNHSFGHAAHGAIAILRAS
ncbi:MAG: multicopper oxidase domain-containing protein [Thermomicrobiales bacterium]|nr:multicopper oxidase domain-containing protein [Thermomicrobiales bacterium]